MQGLQGHQQSRQEEYNVLQQKQLLDSRCVQTLGWFFGGEFVSEPQR